MSEDLTIPTECPKENCDSTKFHYDIPCRHWQCIECKTYQDGPDPRKLEEKAKEVPEEQGISVADARVREVERRGFGLNLREQGYEVSRVS